MRTIVFPDREVGRLMTLLDDGTVGRELAIARGEVTIDDVPVVLSIVDGDDLAFLRDLPARAIDGLHFQRCEDPSELAYAAHLDMERLDVGYTQLTDAGVTAMPEWPELSSLILTELPITDASVASLAKRTSLRQLNLGKTKISPDGFFVLRAALPRCDVHGP